MSAVETLLRLHDVDQLLRELRDPGSLARLKQMGFELPQPLPAVRLRERLLVGLETRWSSHYVRAQQRYGRGLTSVRGRACQGCFMTLATAAAPAAGESLTLCESCGRVLYWPVSVR